ncbi:MAG: hypothetical protein NT076_00080 [Candidatus Pacearchaeota archaeon]|nr:hypothetical protein [Candidatus Pacearchaeota archaeon]
MVEKDVVFSGKVRHLGIFDFKEFYRFCYMWFVDKEYWITEKNYTEKITPRGKEIEIEWVAMRKISDYFRFYIKSNWRIIGMKEVEVEKDGKKETLDKGDVEIRVQTILEKDYEHRWEGNAFYKFLRTMYDRYLIRGRIDDYESRIFGEVEEFLAQAKAFLALEGKH